jgi:hypothetical protein
MTPTPDGPDGQYDRYFATPQAAIIGITEPLDAKD